MKSQLKFHFMNPFEKWKYNKRRRFPWKLIVQMIVIILATIQVMMTMMDDDRDIILSLSFSSYVCVLTKGERLRHLCSRIETLLLIYSSW